VLCTTTQRALHAGLLPLDHTHRLHRLAVELPSRDRARNEHPRVDAHDPMMPSSRFVVSKFASGMGLRVDGSVRRTPAREIRLTSLLELVERPEAVVGHVAHFL
jgi:hypothetical protein